MQGCNWNISCKGGLIGQITGWAVTLDFSAEIPPQVELWKVEKSQ